MCREPCVVPQHPSPAVFPGLAPVVRKAPSGTSQALHCRNIAFYDAHASLPKGKLNFHGHASCLEANFSSQNAESEHILLSRSSGLFCQTIDTRPPGTLLIRFSSYGHISKCTWSKCSKHENFINSEARMFQGANYPCLEMLPRRENQD